MPDRCRCVERRALRDRVDEVLVVARQIDLAGHLLQRLVPLAVELPPDAVADDEHPLRAVERGPVLVALLHIPAPDPLLEDELPALLPAVACIVRADHVLP